MAHRMHEIFAHLLDAIIRELPIEDIQKILEEKPDERTIQAAMMAAVSAGSEHVVSALIQYLSAVKEAHSDGDEVEVNEDGKTPLMIAVSKGYTNIVKMLLDNRHSFNLGIDIVDVDGYSVFEQLKSAPSGMRQLFEDAAIFNTTGTEHISSTGSGSEQQKQKHNQRGVVVTAPTNIAVVKYWGKSDEGVMLPLNGSISVTLDAKILHTRTVLTISPDFTEDELILNGEEADLTDRIASVLSMARDYASNGNANADWRWKLHIESRNTFPTAAGLASSASGLAALAAGLVELFGLDASVTATLARHGSGSASRSTLGGIVLWDRECVRQLAPSTDEYWSGLRAIVVVCGAGKKAISSTAAMERSVLTSDLLKYRAEHIVPKRLVMMENAVKSCDWETFAEITMKDSNQLHAICQDTFPPITYLTATSRRIINIIHWLNSDNGRNVAAYTFDAGPNAVIYAMQADVAKVVSLLMSAFPFCSDVTFGAGVGVGIDESENDGFEIMQSYSDVYGWRSILEQLGLGEGDGEHVESIILTKIGDGPCVSSL